MKITGIKYGKRFAMIFTLIFFIGFVFRVGYVLYTGNAKPHSDAAGYDRLGFNLAEYGVLGTAPDKPSSRRAPIYPLFLAAVYKIFGHSYPAVKIIQAVISMFTCLLIFLLAVKLTGSRITAMIAFAVSAIYPYFIYYNAYLLMETLLVFFSVLMMLAIIVESTKPSKLSSIVLGVTFGLSILVKPVFLLYIPLVLLGMLVVWKQKFIEKFGYILLIILFTVIMVLPWGYRNYKQFNSFKITQTAAGLNLLNSTYAYQKHKIFNSLSIVKRNDPVFDEADRLKLSDIERDKYYYKKAVEFIKDNPSYFLVIAMEKVWALWKPYPAVKYLEMSRKKAVILMAVSLCVYGLLLPFALYGMVICLKNW